MIGLHFSPSSYLYRKHPARQPAGKPWGKIEKSFTPSPLVHELLKHQPQYHHRVLTAFKISGYSSSSDKKKAVEVLINMRILKWIQIWVYGTKFIIFNRSHPIKHTGSIGFITLDFQNENGFIKLCEITCLEEWRGYAIYFW